jgi:uncharacterized protein (DUF58 family)
MLIKRFENIGRNNQLYIVPTLDGLKLLCLNLILLVIGLVYANNYVLLFNFILFCLFIGSMYYTHFNLQGLKFISARIHPLHANENGVLSLTFKSRSALGHHFLGVRFKNKFIQTLNSQFSFSFNAQENLLKVDIPLVATERGVGKLPRIIVETFFPFHLFRCFVYFSSELPLIIYPERKDYQLHDKTSSSEEKHNDGDDFYLKNYQAGDSLKRIYWKKVAQSNQWFSKKLINPDLAPVMLSLSSEKHSKQELEKELSSLCFALHQLHSQNIKYGLKLGAFEISPDHSTPHLNLCLKALAQYEV